MSVSISNNNKNVTLTWMSASHFAWDDEEGAPWLYRFVKAVGAFLCHINMPLVDLDNWFENNPHHNATLQTDYQVAIRDRRIRLHTTRQQRRYQKRQAKAARWQRKQQRMRNPGVRSRRPGR